MASSVLVLGAQGRLGQAACAAFATAGWRVLAHVRPGRAALDVPGVQTLATDLPDALAPARAAGVQVVVHAVNPPYTDQKWQREAPVLMDAAIRLSRALGATLMFPGNVYNFGQHMPVELREDTPQNADTAKGRVRVALEQQLQAATRDGSLRARVIRAGDFFGAGKGTWLDLLIAAKLKQGTVTLPGPLDVKTPWAYLPDLARCFVQVAQHSAQTPALETPAFEVLHFAGYQLSGQDWLDVLGPLAQARGWLPAQQPPRLAGMPWALLRAGSWLVPTWASLLHMRYLWHTPHRLCNDKLIAYLGAEPHTPLADAVDAAVSLALGPAGSSALGAAPATSP